MRSPGPSGRSAAPASRFLRCRRGRRPGSSCSRGGRSPGRTRRPTRRDGALRRAHHAHPVHPRPPFRGLAADRRGRARTRDLQRLRLGLRQRPGPVAGRGLVQLLPGTRGAAALRERDRPALRGRRGAAHRGRASLVAARSAEPLHHRRDANARRPGGDGGAAAGEHPGRAVAGDRGRAARRHHVVRPAGRSRLKTGPLRGPVQSRSPSSQAVERASSSRRPGESYERVSCPSAS